MGFKYYQMHEGKGVSEEWMSGKVGSGGWQWVKGSVRGL